MAGVPGFSGLQRLGEGGLGDVFPYEWNLHTGQNYLSRGIYAGPQPCKPGSLPFNPH